MLHWHLVDTTSFPFESYTYPELSQTGAYTPDHIYTHDDVATIVQYAYNRGIRVIPGTSLSSCPHPTHSQPPPSPPLPPLSLPITTLLSAVEHVIVFAVLLCSVLHVTEFDTPGHVQVGYAAIPNLLTQCYNGDVPDGTGPLNPTLERSPARSPLAINSARQDSPLLNL